MNTFFENKDHYKVFLQQWKKALTHPKNQTTYIQCNEYKFLDHSISLISEQARLLQEQGWEPYGIYRDEASSSMFIRKGTGTAQIKPWVTASHFMFYNIIRNKPLDNGFNPIKNQNKLNAGHVPVVYVALANLIKIKEQAKNIQQCFLTNEIPCKYQTQNIDKFMKPFIEDNWNVTKYILILTLLANLNLSSLDHYEKAYYYRYRV